MRVLATGLAASLFCAAPALAQQQDRDLERIALALAAPSITTTTGVTDFPKQLGPFTIVAPQKRGEVVRLSLPVGEYVMKTARGVAGAHRRRKEAAIRRRIEEELKQLRVPRYW